MTDSEKLAAIKDRIEQSRLKGDGMINMPVNCIHKIEAIILDISPPSDAAQSDGGKQRITELEAEIVEAKKMIKARDQRIIDLTMKIHEVRR